MKIDTEIILKILSIGISLLSLLYTYKIDKREEKRYVKASKDKLRYEALLIAEKFSFILNRYSSDYDSIEYWVKEIMKFTKIDGKSKINKRNLPIILNLKENLILEGQLSIYDYKEIVKEFTKDEINYIDSLFKLKDSIETHKGKIANKYEQLNSDDGFVDTDSPEMRSYFDEFNSLRFTYQTLFYMICVAQSKDFEKIFKKIDDLTNFNKEKTSGNLIDDYEYIKKTYLNHDQHLESLKKEMKQYLE